MTSEHLDTTTHRTCPTTSLPPPLQAVRHTWMPNMWRRTQDSDTLPEALPIVQRTKVTTSTNPRLGPEPRTGNSGRPEENESIDGVYKWHRTVRRITWRPTTERRQWWRPMVAKQDQEQDKRLASLPFFLSLSFLFSFSLSFLLFLSFLFFHLSFLLLFSFFLFCSLSLSLYTHIYLYLHTLISTLHKPFYYTLNTLTRTLCTYRTHATSGGIHSRS